MKERVDLAQYILDALRDDQSGLLLSRVVSKGLDDVRVDGSFDLLALSDKLIAAGWARRAND